MSQDNRGLDLSFRAGQDMRTTTAEYVYVRISGSQTVSLITTLSSYPIGILQNGGSGGPDSGGSAVVRVSGTSKLQFNNSIAAGLPFIMSSLGMGLPLVDNTLNSGPVMGRSLNGSVGPTGAIHEILFTGMYIGGLGSQTVA